MCVCLFSYIVRLSINPTIHFFFFIWTRMHLCHWVTISLVDFFHGIISNFTTSFNYFYFNRFMGAITVGAHSLPSFFSSLFSMIRGILLILFLLFLVSFFVVNTFSLKEVYFFIKAPSPPCSSFLGFFGEEKRSDW